jgi:hypothetical protein
MKANHSNLLRRAIIAATVVLTLASAAATTPAKGKLIKGEWVITVTAPDSATGYQFGTRTFTIKARNQDMPPSPLPLRLLSATSEDGAVVQGVWRQSGKNFSLTFELPCAEGEACATIILRGKIKPSTEMRGQTILILDNRDRDNAAGYETVNGSFEGFQR